MSSNSDEDNAPEPEEDEPIFMCRKCPGIYLTASEKDNHRATHHNGPSRRGRGRKRLVRINFGVRLAPSPPRRGGRTRSTARRGSPPLSLASQIGTVGAATTQSTRQPTQASSTSAELSSTNTTAEQLREKLRQKFLNFKNQNLNRTRGENSTSTSATILNNSSSTSTQGQPGPSTSAQASSQQLVNRRPTRGRRLRLLDNQDEAGPSTSTLSSVRNEIQPGPSTSAHSRNHTQPGPSTSAQSRNDTQAGPSTSNTSGSRSRRRPRFNVKWEKIVSFKCPYCPGKLFRADERETHDREHFPVNRENQAGQPGMSRREDVYTCVHCPGLAFNRIEKRMHKRHHKLGRKLAERLNRPRQ